MEYLDNNKLYQIKRRAFFVLIGIVVIFSMVYFALKGFDSAGVVSKLRLISVSVSIISLLAAFFVVHDILLKKFIVWRFCLLIVTGYLNLFIHEISQYAVSKMPGYIVFIFFELASVIVLLWISKANFGRIIHTFNIIHASTHSLFMLSVVFSAHYNEIYNIAYNVEYNSFISMLFSYCKISMRYYFEFPPDEYLDIFTFFQFIIGKIYEAVLIGGMASFVMKTVGASDDK